MTNYYYCYYYYNYNKTNKFSGKQLFINIVRIHVASLARVHATLRLGRVTSVELEDVVQWQLSSYQISIANLWSTSISTSQMQVPNPCYHKNRDQIPIRKSRRLQNSQTLQKQTSWYWVLLCQTSTLQNCWWFNRHRYFWMDCKIFQYFGSTTTSICCVISGMYINHG